MLRLSTLKKQFEITRRSLSVMRITNAGAVVTPSRAGKSIETFTDVDIVINNGKIQGINARETRSTNETVLNAEVCVFILMIFARFYCVIP